MKLAILFWCYKELELCAHRLRQIRSHNPNSNIYILFGGPEEQAKYFEAALTPLADDWYVSCPDKDAHWKWLNGDLLITDWFRNRGHTLHWDTIFVHQWDMLVLGNIRALLPELKTGEILLSNVRPVDSVRAHWHWVRPDEPENSSRYESFVDQIRRRMDGKTEPLACLFIMACLPRNFLEQYSTVNNPEAGMIEYRLPTYASLFNIPFCNTPAFDGWWEGLPESDRVPKQQRFIAPSDSGNSVSLFTIWRQRIRKQGARVFHPFIYPYPENIRELLAYTFNTKRLKRRYWLLCRRIRRG